MKKIILSLFFISLFLSFFLNIEKINVPYFGGIYKNIKVDLTLKENVLPDVFLDEKKADNVLKIDDIYSYHYLFEQGKSFKVNKIRIDNEKNIEKIIVYNGNEIIFPSQSEIIIDNSKDIITCFSIFLLSLFYNFWFYLVPYILLFIFISKYKIKIKEKFYLPILLILAFILRISSLSAIPFWDDEIYSIVATDKSSDFMKVFQDPGNPPLYFIYLKLFRLFLDSENILRFSSVILGILFCYVFYIWLKKTTTRKTACFGLFLASFNIILIYYSQELRSYIMLMLFSVLCAIFLFNFKKQNKLYYFLSSLALIFTHFYGVFLLIYNFIFGLFYLSKKRLRSFVTANVIPFIMFLPLLIYKKESITSSFNSWINVPSKMDYILLFKTFSGSVLFFFIFVALTILLYCFSGKKKLKIFLLYNFFAIAFVIAGALTFSCLIKPIFFYKYFYVVFPMYFYLVCLIINKTINLKYGFILSFVVLLAFGFNQRLNKQNLYLNHNLYLQFILHNTDNTKNNYIFMSDTVKGYKKFENILKNINATPIYSPINKGLEDIDPLEENLKKPFRAYILNLYLRENAIKQAKNINIYKTPVGVFLITDYE